MAFLLLILSFTSCLSRSTEEYHKTFDLPLMRESRKLMLTGDYQAFIALQKRYLSIAQEKDYQEGAALCYIHIARINYIMSNFKNALKLLDKAENMLKNSQSTIHRAILYDGYAELNKFLTIYNTALYYNEKALNILIKTSPSEIRDYLLYFSYMRRGDFLCRDSQFDLALHYFHKGRSLVPDINTACVMAEYHLVTNHLDSVAVYLDEVTELLRAEKKNDVNQDNYHMLHADYVMGNYYTRIHNYKKADTAYQKALQIGAQVNQVYSFYVSGVYLALIDFYKETGNPEKENYFKTQYTKETYRLNSYATKNISPALDKFILEIEHDKTNRTRKMWFWIGASVICMLLIGIYIYRKIIVLRKTREVLHKETSILKAQIDTKEYDEVIALAKKNDPAFPIKFQESYPEFVAKLLLIDPNLEQSELTFCALIKLNFTSKEIATYTQVLPTSIQQRKRRLRKKFAIPSHVDLYEFFHTL